LLALEAINLKRVSQQNKDDEKSILGYYEMKKEVDNNIIEFSKLNIFVGKNNSGKSRFMRGLLEEIIDNMYVSNKIIAKSEINLKINRFETRIKDEFGWEINYNDMESYFGGEYCGDFLTLGRMITYYKLYENTKYISEVEKFCKLYEIRKGINGKEGTKRIYIPTLRGLRGLNFEKKLDFTEYIAGKNNENLISEINKRDYYKERTKKDYSFKTNVEIITGLNFYEDIKRGLLGSHEERKIIRDYELFLQNEVFEGREITLTPKIDSDVVYIQIDNEEKAIYDLGDGIQSIIILTFPMFFNKGEKVIFAIEEPELFLHPELQRKLIELMLDKDGEHRFENFQFFMTTHSNHFLDLILEEENISVFSFKKNNSEEFQILKENTKTVVTLMDELGVRNSSVFLANCTIWVEGITDRLYIRKIFEVWQKNEEQEGIEKDKKFKVFKEDVHFSFIEYSGGNITHWSFLDKEENPMKWEKINNKIFLIADSDGHKEGDGTEKGKRIETLKENLGDKFYCLEAKEIENTLSIDVIKNTIKHFEGEDIEFISNISEDYSQENIGEFITRIINGKSDYIKGNTIKNKKVFCKEAIKNINTIQDLSEEQRKLCKKIYEFLKKSNGINL